MGIRIRSALGLLALATVAATSRDFYAQSPQGTAPFTTADGLTVDLPANWQRMEVGSRPFADAPDRRGAFRYHGGGGVARGRIALIQSVPESQTLVAGENRIFYYTLDGPPGMKVYEIVVTRGEHAWAFQCGEAQGAGDTPAGCLTIARSARPATPATRTPAVPSTSTTQPATAREPVSPSAPASGSVASTDATTAGEILPPGWRDFGNVPVATTKTIRVVLPCNSLQIQRVSPPERQSEFRVLRSEPPMGRTAVANGRQVPFQCPPGSTCVHPFTFSPATPIDRIIVNFTCDTVSHMMFGSAR